MKTEITGATHTYSGEIENYSLNFDTPLNEEKHFMISLSHAQTGLFIASKNPLRFSSNKDIIVPKGTKQIPFEIAWLKEERVEIIAADFSSSETTLKEVNVQCRNADIKINPPEYQINNTIQLQIKFDSLPSQYSLVTKWEYDSAFLQKIGDLEVMYLTGYQSFKINKWGKSDIKIAISIKNDTLGLMYEYYKHNIKLNVPCPCKLVATEKYTCPNSIITYKIEGLLGGEKIKWKEDCKNAKLSSGQGTDTAIYIAQSQGEIEVSATISYNGESTTISNKEVWAGKPTINTGLETSHVMTERNPVIIDASNEFFHYTGGISYAMESEDAEYVTITETDKKFKIETTIPGNKRGEIKLCLRVSNDCGEVSNLHTIAYDTLPGVSVDKPIQLRTQKDHGFYTTNNYELSKYVGELQKFQMFFAFKLERKTDIDFISRVGNTIDYQPFKIYHKDDTELTSPIYTYTPSDNYMKISEMPIGEYLWVIDINRNNQPSLHISLNAFIRGGDPHVPYIVDKINGKIDFQDFRDTRLYDSDFKYTDENGQLVEGDKQHNYVYYLLRLEKPTTLLLHSAHSYIGAELRIMTGQPFGWQIIKYISGIRSWEEVGSDIPEEIKENLLLGCICNKTVLPSGEYTLVFNGYKYSNGGANNGLICMNILEVEK